MASQIRPAPKFLSIIVPCFNEQNNIVPLATSLAKQLGHQDYELILVDDGSTDDSLQYIKTLAKEHAYVHFLSFSRNFGHQAALRAGLKYAKGDVVISMDGDLQHPPALIPDLISKWREGFDIVNTVRQETASNSWFKTNSSRLFYKFINYLSGLNINEGSADFRLLDRKVVEVINQQQESNLFLRGYIDWLGYKHTSITYKPATRYSGSTKYSFRKMISFAGNGITQFSIKPLRVAYSLAMVSFLIAFSYALYAFWVTKFQHQSVRGWASLVILFVFLQGIQFLMIGLNGEYLGRTFMQTKHRPEFIINESDREE